MKQIIIINGVYGYRPNGGQLVEPKRAGDPAFEVSDEEAARLVAMKVAKIVEIEAKNSITGEQQPAATHTPAKGEEGGSDAKLPTYDESMKLEQLKEIAKVYGVDDETVAGLRTKKAAVGAIDAKRAADNEKAAEAAAPQNDDEDAAEDDGEQPPDLNAADPV